jgi:transcriptional regulator GlxA family with amidase domain
MHPVPVYFLLLPGYVLMELAGPAEAFRLAGQCGAPFSLHYISPVAAPVNALGLTLSGTAALPDSLPENAWLIIPGTSAAMAQQHAGAMDKARQWLVKACRPDTRVITICSGALLLARTGLLDGRRCTTHHVALEQLRALAPLARVEANRVFVIDGQFASSAGMSTGVDLMLELIAGSAGPKVALDVAREMVVWLRRDGDSAQLSPFLNYRNHLHAAVHRVQDALAADPARDWSSAQLAHIACVTPRHLARIFKTHTGIAPIDYRRQLQLGLVDGLIARRELSLERIAEASGFGSARDMRRVWLKQRGEALRRT